jgi:hypothetical protein
MSMMTYGLLAYLVATHFVMAFNYSDDDDNGADLSTLMRHLQFRICDFLTLYLEHRGDLCCALRVL